jgi:type II secretory pathway pseudopilin PulG
MKEKSFTLVELLAVIFIIGILAGLLLPTIGKVRRDAQIKAQQAEIRAIAVALESFYSDYLQYPPDPNDIDSTGTDSHDATLDSFTVDNPDDPEKNDPNIDDTVDLDNASEVFYYYLCRKWEKTGGTVVCQIALDIDSDGNIDDHDGADDDGDGPIDEDNINVPGGNGSPYLAPKRDRIGDSDGDGYLELLDIWGRPYLYWNNADGVTCLIQVGGNPEEPFDSAVVDGSSATAPPEYPHAEKEAAVDVWHHPINSSTFDIYSLGPNRADNLGFNDINFGYAKTDDDLNGPNGGTVDDEDDVNNY